MERRRSANNIITSPCRLGSTSSNIKTETMNSPWTNDFKVHGTIGRGKFAVVKKCESKLSGQQYAAKCIRKRRHNRDCTPDILHEIAVLEMGIDHPHLIKLHKVYETPTEFVLILEYAAGGEIFDHCVGVKDTFSEHSSRRLMKQILDAVHFLHSNDIVHLDLKPQNILLSKDGADPESTIKLVDFGLSKYIADGLEIREILGTPDYVAPEVLNYEPLSTATDVWSLGVVAYVLLTGVSPFLGETKQDTLMNVTTAVIDFPEDLFGDMSSASRDFIAMMLQREPIDRCTALQAMHHPWITGLSSPETPISCSEENGHEDVFLNGNSEEDTPETNGTSATTAEEEAAKPTVSKECDSTDKPDVKASESSDRGSDVDINGNILDANEESSLSTPTSCQTLSDLSLVSDEGSSVDFESAAVLMSNTGRSFSTQSKSNPKPGASNIANADCSPSTRITNLTLSSSSQPTSPAMPRSLPKETESQSTAVDSDTNAKKVKNGTVKSSPGTSVDPVVRNASEAEPIRRARADPCLKRRKFDYCHSGEQSTSEISVAE